MQLQRDRSKGVLGGVCAGVAVQVGAPVATVRLVFALAALAGGIGAVAYALLWVLAPAAPEAADAPARTRWFTVAVVLVVAGILLLVGGPGRAAPVLMAGVGAWLLWWRPSESEDAGASGAMRVGVGIGLVTAAGLVFIAGRVGIASLTSTVGTVAVVLGAAALVASPLVVRLIRDRDRERAERIQTRQRAEIAAHLHDSVLQTLTLIQRDHGDPDEVLRLARAEERGLREWLYGPPISPGQQVGMAQRLQQTAAGVEQSEAAVIEVVTVGDADVDGPAAEAVVAAAREAMLNGVRHSGDAAPLQVFARIESDEVTVFVRDRGVGFDPDSLPEDRGGVRESIVGRISRTGGTASVRSAAGAGTEIQIRMPL